MSSKLQSNGCYYYYSQRWRRQVNAYEVKAGIACLQCKWSILERFRGESYTHNVAL